MSNINKAILLPNIPGFPSESMKRYGDELFAALCRLDTPGWSFDALNSGTGENGILRLPGVKRLNLSSRMTRFVYYPRIAREAALDPAAAVLHVLDHSHANLTRALPEEKAVITCHDIIPLLAAKGLVPISTGRLTKYTFPLRIRCMERCRYVIADSEATKKSLIEHSNIPESRIVVVYLGVDPIFMSEAPVDTGGPDRERAALLARHQIPADASVIMHLATAGRYKNTPTVLRVLKQLRDEPLLRNRRDVYLLRVGAPFYEDEQALIAELGIADRIVHLGRVATDAELAACYRAADVFLFPSLWEGFGWPPLEAMACGTPVITSNISSLPEVVGDGGMTAAPNDVAAFTDAVQQILTNEALASRLVVAARTQAAKFTWENCAKGVFDVYQKVAGN